MNKVIEYIGTTGEVIRRPLTPEEEKRRDADEKAAAERARHDAAMRKAHVHARAAAVAHAKSLGFTDEMIAVMYPGLAEPPK